MYLCASEMEVRKLRATSARSIRCKTWQLSSDFRQFYDYSGLEFAWITRRPGEKCRKPSKFVTLGVRSVASFWSARVRSAISFPNKVICFFVNGLPLVLQKESARRKKAYKKENKDLVRGEAFIFMFIVSVSARVKENMTSNYSSTCTGIAGRIRFVCSSAISFLDP